MQKPQGPRTVEQAAVGLKKVDMEIKILNDILVCIKKSLAAVGAPTKALST